jgi:hypothetical protein
MVQEPHGFYDLGLISVRPSLREWAWASLKTVKLEKNHVLVVSAYGKKWF